MTEHATHRPAQTAITINTLGGPTALIDIGGLRLLTDPTFDGPGQYPVGGRVLCKTSACESTPNQLGRIDVVLLSHDQHPDNLDTAGREFLSTVPLVLTTRSAASRLGAPARGLSSWETVVVGENERAVTVTGLPARHGPAGCEPLTGEVTGFLLHGEQHPTVYVSGDNASIEVVEEIAGRVGHVDVAVIFAGAARTPLIPGEYLTLTSEQAVEASIALGCPHTVVVHTEGWDHFTQDYEDIREAFARHGLSDVLRGQHPRAHVVL